MKETTLLKLALICSLVGLFLLYFISTKIEIKDYRPNVLSSNAGDDVKLKGTISKVTDKGNVVFVELSQEFPVSVVVFTNENFSSLKKNDLIEVFGKVQEYNGKNEIVAQKIMVVK